LNLPAIPWRVGTVAEVRAETATARTLAFELDGWPGHRPGQYVDVRLTAEDGYRTQRSYSIASAPEDPGLELTVERYELGEVSPYLAMEARPGDRLELRGPIGTPFTWGAADPDPSPLFLVGGGSGVVPFRAMLRHRAAAGSPVPATLLVSARTREHLYYGGELERLADATVTLTREAPRGWIGAVGRVGPALLQAVAPPPAATPRIYVCGPTGFVEAVATELVELGHPPRRIATERFGPSR
jgi:ferredoxin-NADP reductase